MNLEDTIISAVIFERNSMSKSAGPGSDDARAINKFGRKMIRMEKAGRIKREDSDEDIAASLSSGLIMWAFWQIAPELLLWIVRAIRRRIWG